MNRLDLIKQIAEKNKAKKVEAAKSEVSFQETIRNLDARKAAKKAEMKLHKKLTRSVTKAGGQSVGSLEHNSPENMYYSDKENARYLENSSIMDAYNANKFSDGDWN